MNACIIGAGSTKFKEHWEYGIRDIILDASSKAIKSANVDIKDVDAVFVANCFSGLLIGQKNMNAVCSDILGIDNSFAIEGGDAAGAYAVVQAANAILSGSSRIALVLGVEKMSDVGINEITEAVSQMADYENELHQGATLASLYAMITQKYMKKYGTTDDQLALASVKAHANASENEIAQFSFPVSKEDVMKSPMVASPIRVLHSAGSGDGCSAIVMCSSDLAKKHDKRIRLIGTGIGSDSLAVHEREDITSFNSIRKAAEKAFACAKIGPEDISFAEVHDSFAIAELIAIEEIGFAKKGGAAKLLESGAANIDGRVPINPSGGLKGCGHPFAATGVRQVVECFSQLNGIAGKLQVKNPKYGLAQSLSGAGATSVINIFSK